jgi:cytochrome P450
MFVDHPGALVLVFLCAVMLAVAVALYRARSRVAATVTPAPAGTRPVAEPPAGLLGHLPLLTKGKQKCAYDSLRLLRQAYGDVFQIRILGKPWICVSDMDMIQKILSSEREAFPKRGDAVDEMAVIFGDQGILVTEGEQWLRQRKMCMPAFRHEQLVAMVEGMNVVAREASRHLAGRSELEIYAFMSRAAFANVCMAAFDHHIDAFADGVHDPVLDAQEASVVELMKRLQRTKYWKSLPLPANFRLDRLLKEQERFLRELIAEKAAHVDDAKILLNEFLRARDDQGERMGETELLHMCIQFMAAGHETTGTSLHWLMYFLATHPDVQERLRAEVNEVMGDRQDITYEDVKRLVYFEQAFNEAMRVRTPIPIFVRAVGQDTVLNDYFFPKDSVVMLMVGDVHTDPRYWGEDAEFFDPSRFDASRSVDRPRAAFIPFGMGPRICIGHRFTVLEAAILVATLIRRYSFRYIAGQNVQPVLKTSWVSPSGIRLAVEALS